MGKGKAVAAASVVFIVIGAIATVVGLVVDISSVWHQAIRWGRAHPLLGWGIAIASLVLNTGLAVALQRSAARHSCAQVRVGQLEQDLIALSSDERRNQVLADISLIPAVVGDLGHKLPVTLEALDMAECKFFDRAFLEPFTELLRQAPSRVEAVYDAEAKELLAKCVLAVDAWYSDLVSHIGPPNGNDPDHHDYLVFRPPDGPWGDNRDRAWASYYAYVNEKQRQMG
ncbi:hypothetical protein, partial [Janibacter indicus]|uniref:hypothetical protein n=1 Tax=Janibacter indicus TaxID=857417 RepID=UPI003EBB8C7B